MPLYATSLRQEDISRNQIGEVFAAAGWPVDSLVRDLGEDLIVRIYHPDEHPTGLAFYVQLKSTSDLSSHALRNSNYSYQFEIGKIIDWSQSFVPVCLVLWDVTERSGYWGMVNDAVRALDEAEDFSLGEESAKSWRSRSRRSKVSVALPQENDFSEQGLKNLKSKIRESFAPIFETRSDSMILDFEFEDSARGREELEAWTRFIEKGESVCLTAASVRAVRFEPHIARLYDIPAFTSEGVLEIGPRSFEGDMTVRLDCFAPDGRSASWPYLEFRPVRGGTRELLFSSQHQNVPVHFEWLIQEEGNGQWKWRISDFRSAVRAVKESMDFMDVMSKGGKLRISWLSALPDGTMPPPLDIQIPPYVHEEGKSLCEPIFRELLEKLCRIEAAFNTSLFLDGWKIDEEEIPIIEKLDAILSTGRLTSMGQIEFEMTKGGLSLLLEIAKGDQPILVRHLWQETVYSLLDERINVGRHSQTTTGKLVTSAETIERALEEFGDDDALNCTIENATVVSEFPDWMSEDEATQVWPDTPVFQVESEG